MRHINQRFLLFSGLYIICLLISLMLELWIIALVPFALLFFYACWQNLNAGFFVLLASIPFSSEIQLSFGAGTDFPDELLMITTGFLLCCYWIFSPSVIPRKFIQHPLLILLAIVLAWSLLTVMLSSDWLISVKFFIAKCWYVAAFVIASLIVFRNKAAIKMSMIIPGISMLMVVIITMARHYFFGFSFAGINPSLVPFFRNHVNYSAMLVCIMPLFFAFFKLTSSAVLKKWLIAAMILMVIALIFSYARGAWLALVTGIAAYWLIQKRLIVVAYFAAMVFSVSALFWLKSDDHYLNFAHDYRSTIFHEDFREHLQATYEFKDVSTAERFYRWIAGVRMIKDEPLTGFGPSTFYDNYKPYGVPAFKTWVSNNPEHSTVHNYFLMITIEQGIPGLLFFLLLTAAMLYYSQRIYHRASDIFYRQIAITCGVVLTMILTVNFLSDLIETDKVGSIFFICLSLLVIADCSTKERIQQTSVPDIN